jgi:hypothetical protein
MKTNYLAICAFLFGMTTTTIAQCDSELSAPTGTYLVKMNPEKVDATQAPTFLAHCSDLELIDKNKDLTNKILNKIIMERVSVS